jgi:peptidoglycan hydrolase-like protein with peptidoglycan-binding domain
MQKYPSLKTSNMRPCHSSIPFFTYFLCLGLYHSPANPAIPNFHQENLILVQASSTNVVQSTILRLGSTGVDVQTLQTQLKELGYYNGVVDGNYQETTKIAVTQFQKAQGLLADGIVGSTTTEKLQAAITAKISFTNVAESTEKPNTQTKSKKLGLMWWFLLGLGILGNIGAVFYLIKWFRQVKPQKSETFESDNESKIPLLPESKTTAEDDQEDTTATNSPSVTASIEPKLLPPENTSRLAKVNIVDELIKDLYSADPTKRHKAIWDLGQQGDSRAIQPLIDLMMDADSQQHSLILSALGEISIRTLKPINRALAISLQNDSPQVRQNAIRDLTRVYDMMSQISQMLRHSLEDPDPEVRSTAKYALNQIHRIRLLPDQDRLPGQENDQQE